MKMFFTANNNKPKTKPKQKPPQQVSQQKYNQYHQNNRTIAPPRMNLAKVSEYCASCAK